MPLPLTEREAYWRQIAKAEESRADRLACEIGDLKGEIAMLKADRAEEFHRCVFEARQGNV